MTSDAFSLIGAIASAPDDAARTQLLRTGGKDLLADPESIGTVVNVALDSAERKLRGQFARQHAIAHYSKQALQSATLRVYGELLH